MKTSLFDIFKVGIGPSSSHTVGPMKAALDFAQGLDLPVVHRVLTELYGSLALTGRGHGTDRAVLLGLSGERPDNIDPEAIGPLLEAIRAGGSLSLCHTHPIPFDTERDVLFHRRQTMPGHPNGLRFTAFDVHQAVVRQQGYYSVGGGFVVREGEAPQTEAAAPVPYDFANADELLQVGDRHGLDIWQIALENEKSRHTEDEIKAWFERIWGVMQACVERGLATEGTLPGGLKVPRRAAHLARELRLKGDSEPLLAMDWVNAYAMAVNEENAAGGRVVTAPTNGAAGIVPAIAHYYRKFVPGATDEGLFRYFLTAGVIGTLYKENASISGADVGCQGEVGVAASMAAGGLVAALGGNNRRVEKAAEIAMEHNLGMTCDPVGGLVQIPCIERNAMGSVGAINAARMAMHGEEEHKVSLDTVIRTMMQTGKDMQTRYKETSLGGLAVNVIEC